MLRIFDEIHRLDKRPARHNESHFAYLNVTARGQLVAVRELLEQWLLEYPTRYRSELRQRLRSPDNSHFLSAFFELYLFILWRRLGLRVQIHPRAGGRGGRPDFLIQSADGERILVEAAVVDESSATDRAARTRLQDAFDALNQLECPDYFLHVEHAGVPATPIPLRRLKARVRDVVHTLDYEATRELLRRAGFDALPNTQFEHDGCSLEIAFFPVSPEHRGATQHRPVGVLMPSEASMVDDRTPLRDKIRSKANRYGKLRRPMIVAVNVMGRPLDKTDVMEALFGKEAFRFPRLENGDLGEPQMSRVEDGAWSGPHGPHNTRVSGVLVLSSLLPWTVTVHPPTLYLNPWACNPLGAMLTGLETHRPIANRMEQVAGLPIHSILELPNRWPFNLPDD